MLPSAACLLEPPCKSGSPLPAIRANQLYQLNMWHGHKCGQGADHYRACLTYAAHASAAPDTAALLQEPSFMWDGDQPRNLFFQSLVERELLNTLATALFCEGKAFLPLDCWGRGRTAWLALVPLKEICSAEISR